MIQEIQQRLARVLTGESSLEEFEDWFLPTTWDLRTEQDAPAFALATQIMLALAEHAEEHLDREELLERFRQLASPRVSALTDPGTP